MEAVADVDEIRDANGLIPMREFADLRDQCLALREVLLPDAIWQQFQVWHDTPDDVAAHRSILLLAFRRGCLSGVTGPIHRYLLPTTGFRPIVRNQYMRDLQERWLFDRDPVRRNCLSRIFRGRLVELQYAAFLESQSHKVTGMEALRTGPDIETVAADGVAHSFEVKTIGVEDGDFRILLESLAGDPAGAFVSPYRAMNYLLFRVYEAARQLRAISVVKNVIVVIDEMTWFRFRVQLKHNWINWRNPTFLSEDDEWKQFLSSQGERYPNLPNDLAATVRTIDSIRILKQDSRFDFSPIYDLSPKL
jgi:hypothetical protein